MIMKNIEPSHPDASAWCDKNLAAVDSLLVKITADEGLEGRGEAFGFRAV
jgi:L-alanine-DL-glutamate epimerase-like enolase superfamily enzyme